MRGIRELRFGVVMCTLAAVFSFPTSSVFALRTVSVTGNRTLSESEVLQLVPLRVGVPLARINLEEVALHLLRHPRIRAAKVELRWPNALAIQLTERIPAVLVVGEDRTLVVDEEGVVLDRGQTTLVPLLVEFPVPSLPPGAQLPPGRLQRAVHALAALPRESRGRIRLARLDPEGGFHAQLRMGPWVRMRLEDDLRWRLEVAEAVVRDLDRRGIEVESVDLRFGDRVTVRSWGRTPTAPVE